MPLIAFRSASVDSSVCTGKAPSEFAQGPYGVPQGFILGSFLFTVYMDELVSAVTHCRVCLTFLNEDKMICPLNQ